MPSGLSVRNYFAIKNKRDYNGTGFPTTGSLDASSYVYSRLEKRVINEGANGGTWYFSANSNDSVNTITHYVLSPSGVQSYTYQRAYNGLSHYRNSSDAAFYEHARTRSKLLDAKFYGKKYSSLSAFFQDSVAGRKAAGYVESRNDWENGNRFLKKSRDISERYSAHRVRLKTKKTIVFEGADSLEYLVHYSAYDKYDKPKQIKEYAPDNALRTTTITYNNTTNPTGTERWRIGRVATRQVSGAGTTSRTYFPSTGGLETLTKNAITTEYRYDGAGNVSSTRTGGGAWHYISDYKRGVSERETNRLGKELRRVVNDDGTVKEESLWGKTNTRWKYTYDSQHRLKTVVSPIASRHNTEYVWSYNAAAREETLKTLKNGNTYSVVVYNALGLPIENRLTSGSAYYVATYSDYDAQGRLKKLRANKIHDYSDVLLRKDGDTTLYDYDGLGRITEEKRTSMSGGTELVSYGYGVEGNFSSTNRKNARNKSTKTLFYGYGSPGSAWSTSIAREDAANDYVVMDIRREIDGRVKELEQGGFKRKYEYYPVGGVFEGLLWKEEHPETGTTEYSYYADGLAHIFKTADNQSVSYTYDNADQLKRVNYPGDLSDVAYSYDDQGNMTGLNIGYGTADTSYGYNDENVLEDEVLTVGGNRFELDYGFNAYGNLNQITYPTGRVYSLAPDILGNVTKVSAPDKTILDGIRVWGNGVLARANLGQNITAVQLLKANHLLSSSTLSRSSSSLVHGIENFRYSYDYDPERNVTNIGSYVGLWDQGSLSNESDDISLTYDGINRLKTAAGGKLGNRSFEYDDVDNIQKAIIDGQASDYKYDPIKNRLTSISGGQLARSGISYDMRGNTQNTGK